MQLHRSEYYALITYMDAQIGRILDAWRDPEEPRIFMLSLQPIIGLRSVSTD
ncbi:MAG TPA: hypothetical protein VFE27_08925 [Acidobacteriaceae bacterium]|nr:hypothetical protein [Acidobacteriaceae bacterium]